MIGEDQKILKDTVSNGIPPKNGGVRKMLICIGVLALPGGLIVLSTYYAVRKYMNREPG